MTPEQLEGIRTRSEAYFDATSTIAISLRAGTSAKDVPALLREVERLRAELDTMTTVAQSNKRHVEVVVGAIEDVPEARRWKHPWMELLRKVTAAEREYRRQAIECWNEHDVLRSVRLRGLADGLVEAREHHWDVIAAARAGQEAAKAAERSQPCCGMHNARCEPPSELCCHDCTEAEHPKHPAGVACVLGEPK